MKILEVLKEKQSGKDLADRIVKEVRVRALNKLEHFRDLFPHFTDHSIRHCEGIISVLDWLVPDNIKKQFNEWELYFLLAAAYLHDIGMVQGCPGEPEGEEWQEYYSHYQDFIEKSGKGLDKSEILLYAKRDFVREKHHLRSQEYIRENRLELGLRESDTQAEGNIVARLALGHREVDLSDKNLFGEIPFQDKLIRRNLLSAYLRLADELDTTSRRTPWAEYEIMRIYDDTSAVEWAKHMSISGVSDEGGIIVIAGECRDHKVFLRLNRLGNELKNKLAEIKRMIGRPYATGDDFYVDDPIPYSDIELRIEHVGYLPIDIKFELQDKEIANLIMGERLYGDRTAGIRELLQNAVDTLREAHEQRSRNWLPRLLVKEENGGTILVVEDNGMGMDEYIIRQYFAKIGISYYRSPDFKGNFVPISEFGIGILSCFMIAEYIEVDSMRAGSEPIHVEIRSLTESFVPRKGSRNEPGTTIKLHLKQDMIGELDLLRRIKKYAKHVEFPILVVTSDGESHKIEDEGLVPDYEDILSVTDEKYKEQLEGIWSKWFERKSHLSKTSRGINVGVTLLDEFTQRNWFSSIDTIGTYVSRSSTRGRIFQEGFLVGDFALEFAEMGYGTWCEVNLTGESRFELTADRSRIAGTKVDIWRKISEVHSRALEELYKLKFKKTSRNWWRYHISHYEDRMKYVPKALKQAAEESMEICSFSGKKFTKVRLSEIEAWNGKVYWVDPENHSDLEYLSDNIGDSILILVNPKHTYYYYRSHEEGKKEWWQKLLEEIGIMDEHELIRDLGAKFITVSIDGTNRSFIDMGYCLGKWRWNSDLSGYNTVFDYNDPFSKILINGCKSNLPNESHLALAEIFRTVHFMKVYALQRKQEEVVNILKRNYVISEKTKFIPVEYRDVYLHECIYG